MNTSNWLTLLALVVGGGGGASFIAKVTRLAVAVEQLVESNKTLVGKVDSHEIRLTKGGL